MPNERTATDYDAMTSKRDALVDAVTRLAAERDALRKAWAKARAILHDLNQHPQADYPVSIDTRIKAFLADTVAGEEGKR